MGQVEAQRVDLFVGKTQVLVERLIQILTAVVPGQIVQKLVDEQCRGSERLDGGRKGGGRANGMSDLRFTRTLIIVELC